MNRKYEPHYVDLKQIKAAMRSNNNSRNEKKLKALKMYGEGKTLQEISKKLELSQSSIYRFVKKYYNGGLDAVTKNNYHGNHRNLTIAEEESFILQCQIAQHDGQVLTIPWIKEAYEKLLGRSVKKSTIEALCQRNHLDVFPFNYKEDDIVVEARNRLAKSPTSETSDKLTYSKHKTLERALARVRDLHDSDANPGSGVSLKPSDEFAKYIAYIRRTWKMCDPLVWKQQCERERKKKKWSFDFIAEQTGLSVNTVKKYESQNYGQKMDRDTELGYLEVFSNLYNVNPYTLLGKVPPDPQKVNTLINPLVSMDTEEDYWLQIILSHIYYKGDGPINEYYGYLCQMANMEYTKIKERMQLFTQFPIVSKALKRVDLQAPDAVQYGWESSIIWFKADDYGEESARFEPPQYDRYQPFVEYLQRMKSTERELLKWLAKMCLVDEATQEFLLNIFRNSGLPFK